ncbi:maleylpyruvate isomerase family mycothiol-dependent enzyme [Pseudonocardia petroleophila]|uniref:maleylpyruvate isomerase family mycothiol-dependent enzyme n=1 Tax=Pseudonocardia petroleophila TaxID=37331 RepID=UPI001C8CC220|nr:maleylpyruvate isomerase family mycothiol-dependent enzyme [Pseudonocardia petroleophila]
MNPSLSRSAVDAAVAAERLRLADHVAGLTDEQWRTPSLCSAWTVRDVVAHLTTTTRITVPGLLVAAVRARGDFDRMEIALAAARAAAHTTAELVGQLRESADSTRRFPGSAPLDPLMDLVIHAQDVARPLGTAYVSPPEVVAAALAHVAVNRFMGAPRRLAGVRLVSADTG